MKQKTRLFAEVVLVVFLLSIPSVGFGTECSGEIEFCSQVSSTKSNASPITCQDKFPGGGIPGDVQNGYVLLKVNNVTPGDVAIAVFTDPYGKDVQGKEFPYWDIAYPTWYEVVPLPTSQLRETPGTWTFTYSVKHQYSPNREVLCSTTFVVGGPTSTLDIDGIWKDSGQTVSFYVQTYTIGSAVVIATKDLTNFYVFLDSNIDDGIDVDDYGNHGHHVSVTFYDSANATVNLKLSGSALQSYSIAKNNGLPANPSNHGIWKTPSCGNATMNYYVQTYDAGSAIVVGTADLSDFYVFMDSDLTNGIDSDELGGKPYHLTMNFASGGSGETLERCVNAPITGSNGSVSASCILVNSAAPPSTFTNTLGMTFNYIPPAHL